MTDNTLDTQKLPRAKSGSKEGWRVVSGQVRPDVFAAFQLVLRSRRIKQTDAVDEAIAQYVEREAA